MLAVLFGVCLLIFACRKEFNNLITEEKPKIPSSLLESAKIWNNAVLGQTTKYIEKTDSWIELKPQWRDSWTVKSPEGTDIVVVPTIENYVNNKSVNIRRFYLFESLDNDIASGRIVEFIGFKYAVNQKLSTLIPNYRQSSINGFDGAIIQYDLNYRWIEGSLFHKGLKSTDKVAIFSKLDDKTTPLQKSSKKESARKDQYLRTFQQDSNGKTITKEVSYLYTPNNIMSVQGGVSGKGSDSTSQLDENVIIGNYGVGSNGGSGLIGGNYGGNLANFVGGATVTFNNYAILCTTIPMLKIGDSYTGGVNVLGFTMTITPPTGSSIRIPVVWSNTCFSIPSYNTIGPRASIAFNTAYNIAVELVIAQVKYGAIPYTETAIKGSLKAQILIALSAFQAGSTFSTGPCSNVRGILAVYCP